MLDKYLAQLYEDECHMDEQAKLAAAFEQLPLDVLEKVAGDMGVTYKHRRLAAVAPRPSEDEQMLYKFAQADRWGRLLARHVTGIEHVTLEKMAQPPTADAAATMEPPPPAPPEEPAGGLVVPPGDSSDQAAAELEGVLPQAIGSAVLAAAAAGKRAAEGESPVADMAVPSSGMPAPTGAPQPVTTPPAPTPQESLAAAGPAAPPAAGASGGPTGGPPEKQSSISPAMYRQLLSKLAQQEGEEEKKENGNGEKKNGNGNGSGLKLLKPAVKKEDEEKDEGSEEKKGSAYTYLRSLGIGKVAASGCDTPGKMLRSKGQGRGLAVGGGSGPIGVPAKKKLKPAGR